MKGLFAIAITSVLLVILYACRSAIYDLYIAYHLTPGKAVSLFIVVDAIIVGLILISVTIIARLAHWLFNRNQEVAVTEFDPSEEYIEAYD